jgi:hypothetical protein
MGGVGLCVGFCGILPADEQMVNRKNGIFHAAVG